MNVRRSFFLILCFVSVAANAAAWRRYSDKGCIGGSECRQNGKRITIALESAPVIGVRFFAHDNVGQRADGKLSVRIDGDTIANYIDVLRNGKLHEFVVDRLRGDKLVIEAANDDEVEIRDIEVLYADRGIDRDRRDRRDDRDYGEDGGCIGGATCGGRRARITIPLRDRRVRSVSFFAHDNVGNRTMGELRIRIDDDILENDLDIERSGREYNVDGRNRRGRLLIIEPTSDDEVVIKDIRVRYDR